MTINDYNLEVITKGILDYQHAKEIKQKHSIYTTTLYPYLTTVINLHIYNLQESEREDAKQNIHIAILQRLNKIRPKDINNLNNYFFIMVKRLVVNQMDIINVQTKRRYLAESAAQLIINNDNFLCDIDSCLYYQDDKEESLQSTLDI